MTHNQPVSQQSNSPSQSFQCNYCILVFKSKYFLHEHVSKVHGFDVDASQGEGDLTPPKTSTAPTLKSLYEYSGDVFSCRHCVFTSSSWPVILKHEKMFHKMPLDERGTVKPPKNKSKDTLKKTTNTQHKQEDMEKRDPSTSKSTSKNNSSSSLLKDLKTHIGSVRKNSNVSPCQSTPKSSVMKQKSPDQETDVQSEPRNTHNCLLCSFTSSSLMDLRSHQQQKHVYHCNMRANLCSAMTTLQSPEMALGSSPKPAKRTHDDISWYPAMKKRKEDASSLESIVIKTKLSGGSSFNFEVSEDEEEESSFGGGMVDLADVADGKGSDRSHYCCKHCHFSHKSSRGVSAHYQKAHPYIRYNFQYILDPDDKSATYRCLECPVEFATVDDLKKHYKDDHPQAPDVFMFRSSDLALVFKCFFCSYTTIAGKFLKDHFKKHHPTEKISNPLMYYSYRSKDPQDKHSQSETFTGTSSPRSAAKTSQKAEEASNETSNTPPTPPKTSPISKRVGEDMYHCKHCTFSNKSATVMLVHCQKKHPDVRVTLDQIKKAPLSTSSIQEIEKLHVPSQGVKSPQKMVSETSKFQGVKSPNSSLNASDDPPEEEDKIFFCQVCSHSLPTVKGIMTHQKRTHNGFKITALQIRTYSAEVQNGAKKSPLSATVSTKETLPSSPEGHTTVGNLFYCQICNYGHHSIRGTLNHQITKHLELKANADLVLEHTAMVRGQTQKSEEGSSFTLPFPLIQEETKQMFFCQLCNFSQSTIRGILNHQWKKHSGLDRSVKEIKKYTARAYKHAGKSHLIKTDLPNSSLCSSDVTGRTQFFSCQCCDYSNSTIKGVMNHQRKKHHDLKISSKQVVRHTAAVHSQKDQKDNNLSGNKSSITISPVESEKSGKLRSLKCSKCLYTTTHLYLMRRHLIKNHQKMVSISELVNSAYRDGQLGAGYHCQWCAYSHAEANRVYKHCQKHHSQYTSISLEHIKLRLYAGPERSQVKKQGPISESIVKHERTTLFKRDKKSSVSQKSGGKAARVYPCRACPFKSSNFAGIKSHYRAVHPWCVKDDGSILAIIRSRQPSENKQNLEGDVQNKIPDSFDRQQQPADGSENSTESMSSHETLTSRTMLKCPVCSTLFNSWHGLKTHCGRKHPEYKPEPSLGLEIDINDPSEYSVYKCKICPYVNTRGHGVLTHCQMKHPSLKARTQNLERKTVKFYNVNACLKRKTGRITGLKGYLCKHCSLVHPSLLSLKVHCKNDHNRTASTKLKTVKQANVIKKHLLSKYHDTHGTISQAGIVRKRNWKCHRCKFDGTTIKDLAYHINTNHKSTAEYTYTCSLCAYSAVVPRYLANHYRRKHGTAAYRQYYKPVQKLIKQQSSKRGAYIMRDLSMKNIKTNPGKGKNVSKLFAPSEKGPFKCKKCTMLSFDSTLLLSIHYTQFHHSDLKMDFTILSRTIGNGSELYHCGHCNIKIQSNKELSSHLNHHAVLRERMKPVCVEPQPRPKPAKPENEELPKSSPSKTTEMVDLEEATGFPCDQCGRAFMSLKGLRSHERSHAALAAFKRQPPLPKHILEDHFSYRPGTTKPFRCRLCSYRTNLMILFKSHLLKNHQVEYPDKDLDVPTTSSKDMDNNLSVSDPQESVDMTEVPNEPVLTQKRGYFEPPDVQQQLNHYKQIALSKAPAPAALQAALPFQDGLFHCEFCNFTTGHISSVRRHYLNRHNGRKLLRCKDCSFFTCFRKKFEMHMEAGGSSCLAEAPKDLRCPLCLYHTRNRNNMIDHIDLHREERVAPIEVRRSKLSRYLEGIVFRCHKCTFTSACDENLRVHMLKHDDIKPYKCRLCYFDCTQLSELEAHLCDKHQVMRNHELVGQVNLVQLENRNGKANEEKEEKCNTEPRNKEDNKDINYEQEKLVHHETEDNQAEQNYKENKAQQNLEEQTEAGIANHDKMKQNDEPTQKQGEHMGMDIKAEQDDGAENTKFEIQEGKKMIRPNNIYHVNKHEGMDVVKLNCELHELQAQRLEGGFNPGSKHHNDEKLFHEQTRGRVSQDRLNCQRQGGTDETNGDQNEKSSEMHGKENTESLDDLSMDCEENPVHRETNNEHIDQYGEMPVLENVYHSLNEEEEQTEEKDELDQTDKCNKIVEEQDQRNENPGYVREERRENDIAPASAPQDGCTSVRKTPLISNEKPFSCKLCGRNLTNTIELERHVLRHGM